MASRSDPVGLARRDRWRVALEVSLWRMGRFARAVASRASKPRIRTFVVLGVVGMPLVVALVASQILTDALWFKEVGQEDAFVRMEVTQLLLVVVLGGFTAAFLIGNALIAIRADRSPASRRYAPAAVTGCALVSAMIGWGARGNWQVLLLWVNRQPFGVEDPLHHRDIGFFVFTLPLLEKLSGLLILIAALAAAVTIGIHTLTGALTWRPLTATRPARVHLALLGSLALLLLAWRLHLATFSAELEQVHPGESQAFPGPHFVDVHVRLIGLRILSYVAVASAIGLAAAPLLAARGHVLAAKRAAILPVAALVIVAIVSESWGPTLIQRYVVNSDPVRKEAPFLAHAIAGTRQAWGLAGVDVHRFAPRTRITSAEIRDHRSQLDNVQLWDTNIAHAEMQQLASDTPFYRPADPTLDAVPARGGSRLTLIGERELDVNRVRGEPGWANTNLVYTHGFGAFRFSGTRTNRAGRPSSNDAALPLRQPRIYFGRQQADAPDWVAVHTHRPEFDRPTAADSGRSDYHYTGSGGIALSNPLLRAAFALRFDSLPLLASNEITSQSRIIMHRDIRDRLHTVAPFIRWDRDPSAFIVGGHIVFLASGYTVSDSYPYAQRASIAGSNASYARLAVEATVDAYSGQVRLYAVDRSDPILRAWTATFPGMFEPISRMPRGIRERLRYPSELFDAQAQLYEQFHMTNPGAFASGADAWSIPTSLSGPIEVAGSIRFDQSDTDALRNGMTPSYRFGTPAGQDRAHLLRSAYYSPLDAQNLVANLDGWITRRGTPELSSRSLPRDHVTLGPAQVSRLVFLTPRVANLLGLRNRELSDIGKSSISSVWLGKPHIVFFAGGIMQIQTIYNVGSGPGAAKRLGITVFINGHAGIGDTLSAALRQAINLPPTVKLGPFPGHSVVHHTVPIRFQVKNGLTETVQVSSPNGTVLSKRLHVRGGPATVQWVPRTPGRFHVRVAVRGVDGSLATDGSALTVGRGAPSGGPTVEFSEVPRTPIVGLPTRIGFKVTGAVGESVRIDSAGAPALNWRRQVHTGRGAINWIPQKAGPARLRIVVRDAEGHVVEAATNLTVRKRSP
jgi:uncharacterized membrane protein (UPF0182 family)